jgi:hypothetical protein
MKTEIRDQRSEIGPTGSRAAEETLRMLAHLPAPVGLEDRVQASLRIAVKTASPRARILAWPMALRPASGWMQSSLLRSAAAAAIAFVVVGGGWVVSSRVQTAQPAAAITTPPHLAAPGGFSSAGAMRTPQTLNGPVVAHPAAAAPQTATKQPRVKPKSANKPIAPPVR